MHYDIEVLTNKTYKVLVFLCANQIIIQEETYCSLSQQKIANSIGITKSHLSKIMKQLQSNALIVSKYKKQYTTNRALDIVGIIENI